MSKMLSVCYPKAGYLYILSNTLWPSDVLKIGRTTSLPMRLKSYNSSQPESVNVEFKVYCKDVHHLEDHVKVRFENKRWKKRQEFFVVDFHAVRNYIVELLVLDKQWSKVCGHDIFTIKPHDCHVYDGLEKNRDITQSPTKVKADGFNDSWWLVYEDDQIDRRAFIAKCQAPSTSNLQSEKHDKDSTKTATTQKEKCVYELPKRKAWVADIIRNHTRYRKLFTTGRYGSYAQQAAVQFCQKIQQQCLTRTELQVTIPQNVSPKRGIRFWLQRNAWLATIQHRGKQYKKTFRIDKCGGHMEARERAIAWRTEMEKKARGRATHVKTNASDSQNIEATCEHAGKNRKVGTRTHLFDGKYGNSFTEHLEDILQVQDPDVCERL